ncbi:hypothetical protein CJU90_3603 [Yarrowia sp. C11]|nr:hypothetical protein CJU90_3603 [Yarrowia sp. C11]
MQFVYSPYEYEQFLQYQQAQQEAVRQQQIQQQRQEAIRQESLRQQKLQKQESLRQQQQATRQQQLQQQLFDYMYMKQLEQEESERQQQLRHKQVDAEEAALAELAQQEAALEAQLDAKRKQRVELKRKAEQKKAEREAELKKQAELKAEAERQAEAKRLAELQRLAELEAEKKRQAILAEQKRQAEAKAKQEELKRQALAEQKRQEALKQAELQRQAEIKRQADKAAADKAAALKAAALKKAEQARLQSQSQSCSPCLSPKPVQSEAEAFADYYSQLTGCPGNGPSFAQALKQLGVNVHYLSDDEDETMAEDDETTQVDNKTLKDSDRPVHVDLSKADDVSKSDKSDTDVDDDEDDLQPSSSDVHPLVAFLQSLGIPATISEPHVAKAEAQDDPDLALADFVESLSDDERPSEATKKASKAAKRAAKAREAAAKAQAEAEAAARAQLEAEEELKQEKLAKAERAKAAKAAKKAKKAAAKAAKTATPAPSTPSKPLPSVVVYSSPVDTEKDVSKQLAKLASTVDRSVETYERIKRAATQSDSEYSNSVSSYVSRIKVIQQAQNKLEQIYDQLDSMTVTNSDEKKERTRLIRRAVSTAEAIDSVVEQLKAEKTKIEKSVSSSDEEEIPRKVTNKTKTSKNSKKISVNGSPVRKVTLETVPDADSASD